MIEFKNVYKSYKSKQVLKGVNLTINTGEFVVLIGSSGCGKTTLLKIINKLNSIEKGQVLIDNDDISKMNDTLMRRGIGYVVQEGGLFPHLTIRENIEALLKINKVNEEDRKNKVDELLKMVNLDPEVYGDLFPSQLSGGQRQRVGVARAFSIDPNIILMDEPFSALDPVTRAELQDEICRLQKKFSKTIIFVTHDMDEAIKIADRICIIQNGDVVQYDTPENILKKPVNDYVKEFVGKNRLWSNPEFIKAHDIMMKNPVQISKDRTLIQAIQVMKNNAVDSILVTDNRKLIGILRLQKLNNVKNYNTLVTEYMTHDFISVYEDTNLNMIVNNIDYHITGIIPVVNHERNLIGYLTKSNLLATLSKQYQDENIDHCIKEVI